MRMMKFFRPNHRHANDAWERMVPIWHLVFYLTLIFCTVITVAFERDLDQTQRLLALGLSIAFGVWHYVLIVYLPLPYVRPRPMLLYVAVATALTLSLINIHPVYWLLIFNVYGQTYGVLPLRWAIPASIGVTAAVTWQSFFARGFAWENVLPAATLFVASIVFGSVMGWFIDSVINESEKRKKLIAELNATRAELAQREREAGTLQERQRLAREIHDTLAQGFTSIVMQLEAAEQALQNDPASAQKFLDTARQTARSSLDEARRVVAALRPELLEQDSLPNALQRTAERWSQENGIVAHTNISGEIAALAHEIEITLLRAAQEALTNIKKHAHASHVELSLAYSGDVITLDVQDNGIGIHANGNAMSAQSGFGLIAMRERVAQLGGKVTVESARGEGTTVAVEIPIIAESVKRESPRIIANLHE